MSEPGTPDRPARARKSLPWLIVGYATLIGAVAFAVAIVAGFVMTEGQRSYTGTAEVVRSDKAKSLCTVEVLFPDGSDYSYTVRSTTAYCETFTPGATINIVNGDISNPEGEKP